MQKPLGQYTPGLAEDLAHATRLRQIEEWKWKQQVEAYQQQQLIQELELKRKLAEEDCERRKRAAWFAGAWGGDGRTVFSMGPAAGAAAAAKITCY